MMNGKKIAREAWLTIKRILFGVTAMAIGIFVVGFFAYHKYGDLVLVIVVVVLFSYELGSHFIERK